jgi:predicted transcriptional regulator
MPETSNKLASKIKAVVEADTRTIYAIAKAAGVERKQLGMFLRGESDMTLTVAGRLCDHYRLELVESAKLGKRK